MKSPDDAFITSILAVERWAGILHVPQIQPLWYKQGMIKALPHRLPVLLAAESIGLRDREN